MPLYAAWSYVLLWPALILTALIISLWRGGESPADMWVLVVGLALELLLAFIGLKVSTGPCSVPEGTLLISNHVGNIVTSASFAVACLSAYLTWSAPVTLAKWLSLQADEILADTGLAKGGKYRHESTEMQSHALQVFSCCLVLPLTIKQMNRVRRTRGRMDARVVKAVNEKKRKWREAAGYLSVGWMRRFMIEGRGDRWIAAGAIWLMVFITGQALILFMTEVFVGDRRIVCWLSTVHPLLGEAPIELGYIISFLGIITGVGLFRFRHLIQTTLENRLNEQAHDLSMQLLEGPMFNAIERAGA